jgi:TRAP-type C4-dicarboxylate transport system permease small subunit
LNQDTLQAIAVGLGAVARLALWLAAIGLVLMTAFIAWQVFGRFVLNDTPTWTETVSIQLMGWFIFLGAAVGIREGYHLSFDVMLMVLSDRAKRVLHTVSDLVVTAFAVGMIVYGLKLVIGTWDATIPNLGVPAGVNYLSIVGGGILMTIFSLERIARRAAGLPTARFGEDHAAAN